MTIGFGERPSRSEVTRMQPPRQARREMPDNLRALKERLERGG